MTTENQEFAAAELGEVQSKSGKFIREMVKPGMSFLRSGTANEICTITEVTDKAVVYVRESDNTEYEIARHRIAGAIGQWEDSPGIRAEKEAAHRLDIIMSLEGVRKKYLDAIDDIESDPLTAWTEILEAMESVSYESYEAGYAAGMQDSRPTAS